MLHRMSASGVTNILHIEHYLPKLSPYPSRSNGVGIGPTGTSMSDGPS